ILAVLWALHSRLVPVACVSTLSHLAVSPCLVQRRLAQTLLMGTGKKRGRPRKDAAFSPPMSEHMALAASRKGARSSSRELTSGCSFPARNPKNPHFFFLLLFSSSRRAQDQCVRAGRGSLGLSQGKAVGNPRSE